MQSVPGNYTQLRSQENTTHPDNPKAGGSFNPDGSLSGTLLEDAAATCSKFAFRRLNVVEAAVPEPDATEAWVSFQVGSWWGPLVFCFKQGITVRSMSPFQVHVTLLAPECFAGAQHGGGLGLSLQMGTFTQLCPLRIRA